MTSPLEHVDEIVDPGCLAETCDKQGCTVELEGTPNPSRLIDMDHCRSPAGRNAKRCDYLFIGENDGTARLWVVPLELKSGGIRLGRVLPQLQAGARVAERIVPGSSSIRFVPVAAHDGKLNRKQIKDLANRKNGILFRNRKYRIQLMRCGDRLAPALR